MVWLAEPFPIEVSERPQSIQLHRHGDGSESDRFFRGLQVQGTEAHVVNFLMATNVFDMPAALFTRYLEFFDIETATPMQTWDQGTRRIYENLSANFRDKIYLSRPVRKVYRPSPHVVVEDEDGVEETFDAVIFACNA